jgi:hypothetical protein
MKFITAMIAAVIIAPASFAGQNRIQEAWEGFSAPEIFSAGFLHEMKALPLEGMIQVGPRAWSGDYWPSKKGSINNRWNSPAKQGWDYYSPNRDELKRMSIEEVAMLSPSEKYDLFIGRYDYPLKNEVGGSANRNAPYWAGICNGWASAALFHNEPTPKIMTNPDGIQIPFGSSDAKALISYFYAFHSNPSVNQMGLRCFFGRFMGGVRGCDQDLNAGAFHIVIANKLGLMREGFIVDIERFSEVWNQPVVGFKSVIIQDNLIPQSSPDKLVALTAVKEIRVKTTLYYGDESDPTWEPVMGTENQKIEKKEFQYKLEIDAKGRIVGGSWESKIRPDFIWNRPAARPEEFTGLFTNLPMLLND